jgi:hypothetical protein
LKPLPGGVRRIQAVVCGVGPHRACDVRRIGATLVLGPFVQFDDALVAVVSASYSAPGTDGFVSQGYRGTAATGLMRSTASGIEYANQEGARHAHHRPMFLRCSHFHL